jgi:hypothetical protein
LKIEMCHTWGNNWCFFLRQNFTQSAHTHTHTHTHTKPIVFWADAQFLN